MTKDNVQTIPLDYPVDEQAMLNSALQPPKEIGMMRAAAAEWLNSVGVLSDWHKNCIIVDLTSSIKQLKDLELEVNLPKSYIKCIIFVGWWTLLWSKHRTKITQRAAEVFALYAPKFNIDLELRHYDRRNK